MKKTYATLNLERRVPTPVALLCNARAHPWTEPGLSGLTPLLGELQRYPDLAEIGAPRLKGDNSRVFSVGADLKLFAAGAPQQAGLQAFFGQRVTRSSHG